MRIRNIILFIILFFTVADTWGMDEGGLRKTLLGKSSKELLQLAWSSSSADQVNDTTLQCLAIITHRYDKNMSKQESQYVVKGWLSLWSVYFYKYFDYSRCLDCLAQANHINTESGGDNDALIERDYAIVYQTVAEQSGDTKLLEKALHCYQKALNHAYALGYKTLADDIFMDLSNVAFTAGKMSMITKDWNRYKTNNRQGNSIDWQKNVCIYRACFHFRNISHKKHIPISQN